MQEISRFIKIVSVVAISLGIIFFIVGYFVKLDWIPNVVFAIGIIVANVPEGLLPTVTVSTTISTQAHSIGCINSYRQATCKQECPRKEPRSS